MQIKLVKGAGSPKAGACWMSALSYYAGYEWSDHPECVDPVIRALCIRLNDTLPDADRERVIGPYLMMPIGTNQGRDLTMARMWIVVDRAVRVWAPLVLERAGKHVAAARLRSLPKVKDQASAMTAQRAADACAACAAYAAADAAACAADAAASAAYAAAAAASAASASADDLLATILDLCAMGEKSEIPQARDLCELPQVCR